MATGIHFVETEKVYLNRVSSIEVATFFLFYFKGVAFRTLGGIQ